MYILAAVFPFYSGSGRTRHTKNLNCYKVFALERRKSRYLTQPSMNPLRHFLDEKPNNQFSFEKQRKKLSCFLSSVGTVNQYKGP